MNQAEATQNKESQTMERIRITSDAPWESTLGYCRAVRVGSHVFVSGTVAVDAEGNLVGPGDAYVQAAHILGVIKASLEEAGARLSDVVRTRIYLATFKDLNEVSRAHREYFGEHPPANTIIEVPRLIEPAMRVEIEADAIID